MNILKKLLQMYKEIMATIVQQSFDKEFHTDGKRFYIIRYLKYKLIIKNDYLI